MKTITKGWAERTTKKISGRLKNLILYIIHTGSLGHALDAALIFLA